VTGLEVDKSPEVPRRLPIRQASQLPEWLEIVLAELQEFVLRPHPYNKI
jgi:hypothetical protein